MKILVYGAGVLGSLYAARLKESGQDVSILARGSRLDNILKHGIVLENAITGQPTVTRVNVVSPLAKQDQYDLVIVLVRKDQIPAVLTALPSQAGAPNILFMVNNCAGPAPYVQAVGRERVLLGFAGAGGERIDHLVRYAILPKILQPTCIGELDGRRSIRIRQIASVFTAAGFPTVIHSNMDAWLKTHAAVVSPIANAIYMAGGDNYHLAISRRSVSLMLCAIREGLRVLRALAIPISPTRLLLFEWIPSFILVPVLQSVLNARYAELVITRHANAARDEMAQIAKEFRSLARGTRVSTPAMDGLHECATAARPPTS